MRGCMPPAVPASYCPLKHPASGRTPLSSTQQRGKGDGKGPEGGGGGGTVGFEQVLQRLHLVLLALQLQGDGVEADVADVAVEDLGQVAQLAALARRAPHLHQHQLPRGEGHR